jgi:hypothetical protein
MKAMRGRIALEKSFPPRQAGSAKSLKPSIQFREALGVRARPRVAFETLNAALSPVAF